MNIQIYINDLTTDVWVEYPDIHNLPTGSHWSFRNNGTFINLIYDILENKNIALLNVKHKHNLIRTLSNEKIRNTLKYIKKYTLKKSPQIH
jgi:hypothetical protein